MVRLVCDMYCSVPSHPTPHTLSSYLGQTTNKIWKIFLKRNIDKVTPTTIHLAFEMSFHGLLLGPSKDLMTTLDQHLIIDRVKSLLNIFRYFEIYD